MIPIIKGPTTDMVCNRTCLALKSHSRPWWHHSFLSRFPSSISYLICHILPYLSYTSHSTSLISSPLLLALTPSYHPYTSDLTNFYHIIPPRICISQPCISQSSHPLLFCFPDDSYLPHLYRLLLLKSFVRNSVVCLIVSRHSTICLSFCSYSSQSINALLRLCEASTR
jgi:hypothetical protein